MFVAVAVWRKCPMCVRASSRKLQKVFTTFAHNEQTVCEGRFFSDTFLSKETCKCQESSMKLLHKKSGDFFIYTTFATIHVWKPPKFSSKRAVLKIFPSFLVIHINIGGHQEQVEAGGANVSKN